MNADDRRFRLIADYVDGLLDDPAHDRRRSEVEQLVATDPRAAADLEWLRRFTATARSRTVPEASPLLHQRLDQYYARWLQAQDVLHAPPPVVRLDLCYDSRADAEPVGVRRGGPTAGSATLIFEADSAEVSLDVAPDGEHTVRLLGQVLLTEESTNPLFEATLISGPTSGPTTGPVRTATESDRFGRFRFDRVTVGPVQLRIGNGELDLEVGCDLGEHPR